ncbi:MAG: hypothetical protein FK734_03800 [Asgard group archaeon]|nr:hypothetical protein [Asgard group archaeon]
MKKISKSAITLAVIFITVSITAMGIVDLQHAQAYIPQVTCYGYVKSHVNQPLSSVTVRLYRDTTILASTTTNSEGYYSLS